jgi:hypothetical protein
MDACCPAGIATRSPVTPVKEQATLDERWFKADPAT